MTTKLMDRAIDALKLKVPPEQQDEIARLILQLTGDEQPPYVCSAEEEAELAQSEAEAARGEFATDEQVRGIWAKHGL